VCKHTAHRGPTGHQKDAVGQSAGNPGEEEKRALAANRREQGDILKAHRWTTTCRYRAYGATNSQQETASEAPTRVAIDADRPVVRTPTEGEVTASVPPGVTRCSGTRPSRDMEQMEGRMTEPQTPDLEALSRVVAVINGKG